MPVLGLCEIFREANCSSLRSSHTGSRGQVKSGQLRAGSRLFCLQRPGQGRMSSWQEPEGERHPPTRAELGKVILWSFNWGGRNKRSVRKRRKYWGMSRLLGRRNWGGKGSHWLKWVTNNRNTRIRRLVKIRGKENFKWLRFSKEHNATGI